MKDAFWAPWQARVAAKIADIAEESRIARYGLEENLIF
jgi:hypothetical protein